MLRAGIHTRPPLIPHPGTRYHRRDVTRSGVEDRSPGTDGTSLAQQQVRDATVRQASSISTGEVVHSLGWFVEAAAAQCYPPASVAVPADVAPPEHLAGSTTASNETSRQAAASGLEVSFEHNREASQQLQLSAYIATVAASYPQFGPPGLPTNPAEPTGTSLPLINIEVLHKRPVVVDSTAVGVSAEQASVTDASRFSTLSQELPAKKGLMQSTAGGGTTSASSSTANAIGSTANAGGQLQTDAADKSIAAVSYIVISAATESAGVPGTTAPHAPPAAELTNSSLASTASELPATEVIAGVPVPAAEAAKVPAVSTEASEVPPLHKGDVPVESASAVTMAANVPTATEAIKVSAATLEAAATATFTAPSPPTDASPRLSSTPTATVTPPTNVVPPLIRSAITPTTAAPAPVPSGTSTPQQAIQQPLQSWPEMAVRNRGGRQRAKPSSPSPVVIVSSEKEFVKEVEEEMGKPVVLYISHKVIIHSGVVQEAEIHWKTDPHLVKKKRTAADLITVLDSCARENPHVKFVHLVANTPALQDLCKELEVPTFPSLQFWKKGEILWDCFGVFNIQRGLSEGLLYYADTAAKGAKVSAFVSDLATPQQVKGFVSNHADQSLVVVGYFMTSLTSCVHMFPAMYALAKAHPQVSLARVFGDADDVMWKFCVEIGLVQAPTFVFYKMGEEVGRFVGGTRADLIGQVLRYLVPSEVCPAPEALAGNAGKVACGAEAGTVFVEVPAAIGK